MNNDLGREKMPRKDMTPPPIFLSPERRAAAAAEPSADDGDGAAIFIRRKFEDGSTIRAMRTAVLPLDSERSQFAPIASMCIAVYAYQWLEATSSITDEVGRAQLRRAFKPWHLQLRIMHDFWLAKQRRPHEGDVRHVAEVLGGDPCNCAVLWSFLGNYLAVRCLPADAAPRLLQHKRLFAEYFSCFEHQLCRSPLFDHCLHVLVDGAEGAPVVVGAVALGEYGQSDGAAVMQVGTQLCCTPRHRKPREICILCLSLTSIYPDPLSSLRASLPARSPRRSCTSGRRAPTPDSVSAIRCCCIFGRPSTHQRRRSVGCASSPWRTRPRGGHEFWRYRLCATGKASATPRLSWRYGFRFRLGLPVPHPTVVLLMILMSEHACMYPCHDQHHADEA